MSAPAAVRPTAGHRPLPRRPRSGGTPSGLINPGGTTPAAGAPHATVALPRQGTVRLGSYDPGGAARRREVVTAMLPDGRALVVDRETATGRDPRLVAEIAADEPAGNDRVVCAVYLADSTRGRCRALEQADLQPQPSDSPKPTTAATADPGELRGPDGSLYRLKVVPRNDGFRELRWTAAAPGTATVTVTLRDVVAAVEDYEPARSLTAAALAAHEPTGGVRASTLRVELERIETSPIVLNRGVREAVDRALAHGLTMSEIATRCGRTKRDGHGNRSGETSWLGRRIGRLPEAGMTRPTPWIHSSTLALIAREGLRISPREVEL